MLELNRGCNSDKTMTQIANVVRLAGGELVVRTSMRLGDPELILSMYWELAGDRGHQKHLNIIIALRTNADTRARYIRVPVQSTSKML
jgi:hypothetical protein